MTAPVSDIRFNEDATRAYLIATESGSGFTNLDFRVVDTATGQVLGAPVQFTDYHLTNVVFSADGSRAIVTGSGLQTSLYVFDTSTGGATVLEKHSVIDAYAVPSEDGTRVYFFGA